LHEGRTVSPRYVAEVQSVFARFITFMGRKFPGAETLADVTPAMAETFMQAEQERGVSARTL